MRKLTLIFSAMALLALLALPASAPAHQSRGHKNDTRGCKALRSSKAGHGIGKCISAKAQLKRQARRLAAQNCKAERAQDQQAFDDTYSGFGDCVKQGVAEAKQVLKTASQDCRDERDADEGAFDDKYGTNANKRNAFGKCVSQHVRDQQSSGDDNQGADDGNDGADNPGDDSADDTPDDPGQSGEQGGQPAGP
jgi:hypothetical protein